MMTELDPRNRAGVTPEIQTMKNQLTEKEKQIQQLEVFVSYFYTSEQLVFL